MENVDHYDRTGWFKFVTRQIYCCYCCCFFCIMITTDGGGSSNGNSKLVPMPLPKYRWDGKRRVVRVISNTLFFYSVCTMEAGVGACARARVCAIPSFKVKSRHISSIAHFFAYSPQTWSRILACIRIIFYIFSWLQCFCEYLCVCVCVLFLSLSIPWST